MFLSRISKFVTEPSPFCFRKILFDNKSGQSLFFTTSVFFIFEIRIGVVFTSVKLKV